MFEEWFRFILCLLESCFQEMGETLQQRQLRGPALEVLSYAMGNEKTPALLLQQYRPSWPLTFTSTPDPQTVMTTMIATWVWHVTLKSLEASEQEPKHFFSQMENQTRLRYLAVSPGHHYRLILGIYWPESNQLLDSHEKIQPKNLLPTRLSLDTIQEFSRALFEHPLSALAIRQHTYRMRVEMLSLFYTLLGLPMSQIVQNLPNAPQSIIKASFLRLTRVLGGENYGRV